ncbi:MAG: metallophosphoesterase [Chloroflexi bacterium]|nr:metallophosphoesterase [Chloroflexota bacterium]
MRRTKGARRQIYFWVLSVIVVASMICSYAVAFRPPRFAPPPSPTPRPTILVPTWTPPAQPSPTLALATPEPALKGPVASPLPLASPLPKEERPSPTPVWPTPPPFSTASPTPTASATSASLSSESDETLLFAVCGDTRGRDDIFRQIMADVAARGAAFLIHTGDLVSWGSDQEFRHVAELLAELTVPFYPVPGNHDNGDGLLSAYLRHSGAPAAHYSLDQGPAHFSFINSSLGSVDQDELEWLAADLAATDRPVKVVTLHHPPFDPAGTSHIMARGNEAFMALVEAQNVDLVLSGHIHSFDDARRNGVRYIITGGGGAPLYPAKGREAFYHYVLVRIQEGDIAVEVVRLETASWIEGLQHAVCSALPRLSRAL